MKLHQFWQEVKNEKEAHAGWRNGQTLFYCLGLHNRKLQEALPKHLDPYFDDKKVPNCCQWICDNWNPDDW